MDFFGIGAAFQAMTAVYRQSAKGTGRTTSLVESLKDGDRVCFAQQADADHVVRLCAERGVEIGTIVSNPKDTTEAVRMLPPAKGRFVFDHTWLELYYQHQIAMAGAAVDAIEADMSDYGLCPWETRRRAAELGKWVSYRHEGEFESE